MNRVLVAALALSLSNSALADIESEYEAQVVEPCIGFYVDAIVDSFLLEGPRDSAIRRDKEALADFTNRIRKNFMETKIVLVRDLRRMLVLVAGESESDRPAAYSGLRLGCFESATEYGNDFRSRLAESGLLAEAGN